MPPPAPVRNWSPAWLSRTVTRSRVRLPSLWMPPPCMSEPPATVSPEMPAVTPAATWKTCVACWQYRASASGPGPVEREGRLAARVDGLDRIAVGIVERLVQVAAGVEVGDLAIIKIVEREIGVAAAVHRGIFVAGQVVKVIGHDAAART